MTLRARSRLGKYRIVRKIAEGGFAAVYEAFDTIEGIKVALKIPYGRLVDAELLETFKREIRIVSRLDHPNILPVKNADWIGDQFVIATPLASQTLEDRLQSRLSLKLALLFFEQMLEAIACAHAERVVHCDIKPDNMLLYGREHLMVSDFGLAKVAQRTIQGSGSGTIGYIAPEQAMGHPSPRSDIFSLGLVGYRILSGELPSWPYSWPPPGFPRLRSRAHPDLIALLQRAMEVNPSRRYADAVKMHAAFMRIKNRSLQFGRPSSIRLRKRSDKSRDWKSVQRRQFVRKFGAVLHVRDTCGICEGPVSEAMMHCPWCGNERNKSIGVSKFPQQCPTCWRGMKLDWSYCPWCGDGEFELSSNRQYSDRRYSARCRNAECTRKLLMPFMHYCPWCQMEVTKKWQIEKSDSSCHNCHWGVADDFWYWCAWCGVQQIAK